VNILAQKTQGRITNYRIGPKAQETRECLIQFETIDSAGLAGKIIGQTVTWENGNKKITGKVRGAHGKNGMVRVRFTRGVPGQALGSVVELSS
jgi:large subunit ribosomal protein L35Ae